MTNLGWPPSEAEFTRLTRTLDQNQADTLRQLLEFGEAEFRQWEEMDERSCESPPNQQRKGCLSENDILMLTELLIEVICHAHTELIGGDEWNHYLTLARACQCQR